MSIQRPAPDYYSPRARAFGRWLMEATGDEWCGNTVPPGDHLTLRVPMHEGASHDDHNVYCVNEDGSSFWIGYPREWRFHMGRKEARRMAWFILWDWWARKEWFGLRRWAWFRGLRLVVPKRLGR